MKTKFRTDVVLDEIFTLDKLKNGFIFTIKLHPKDDEKNYKKYSNKISKFLKIKTVRSRFLLIT